ncbi:MAG TPA: hypothetical protein VFX41_04160 [Actinomycetales bacterium]|jgi:hypothetical protein|nr:hypothetical protein [Actinomycetales bacterium]
MSGLANFVAALVVLGVLMLLLRWTFSRGHSLVESPPKVGRPDEYGLLVSVAEPKTFIEAEMIAARLRDAGLRATLAPTLDGPRVLVFESEREQALKLLAG